jgi:hypothetical protein
METIQMPYNWRVDQEMWFIKTVEFYSAMRNNDTVWFKGKWMQLEDTRLSEVR